MGHLPKHAHPDFALLGRKPTGPVEIDWQHPSTRGLALCLTYMDGVLVDLVTGKHLTTVGNPYQTGKNEWYFDGVSDAASIALDLSPFTAVSISAGFDWANYSNNDDFFAEHTPNENTSAGFAIDPNAAAGDFQMYVSNGSGNYIGIGITRPDAGYHDYFFRLKRQQDSVNILIDGVEPSFSQLENSEALNGTSFINSTLYFNSRNTSTLFGESTNRYFFLWTRDIWGDESVRLNRNPYQILRPVIPVTTVKANATIFLRPDADSADGNWTNDAGSNVNLYASIDEATASDVDYIQSGESPSADRCKIGLADPANNIDLLTAGTLKYRYYKTGDQTTDLTVRLVEGTTTRATWTHSGISASVVEASQTVTTTVLAAITDFDNLYLEFEADVP